MSLSLVDTLIFLYGSNLQNSFILGNIALSALAAQLIGHGDENANQKG